MEVAIFDKAISKSDEELINNVPSDKGYCQRVIHNAWFAISYDDDDDTTTNPPKETVDKACDWALDTVSK